MTNTDTPLLRHPASIDPDARLSEPWGVRFAREVRDDISFIYRQDAERVKARHNKGE